jgi:hypothetical protein
VFEIQADNFEHIRDPFYPPCKTKKLKLQTQIKLDGIVKTKGKIGAIVDVDGESELVFATDKIADFVIQSINIDHVVLMRGKKIIKIFIEE